MPKVPVWGSSCAVTVCRESVSAWQLENSNCRADSLFIVETASPQTRSRGAQGSASTPARAMSKKRSSFSMQYSSE